MNQFSKIWYQTMIGDFRLWRSIFNGLETQAKLHPNRRCQSNAAFQLAFCYQIGFGCDRCGSQSLSWLDRSGRCAEDLDHEVKFIQANEGPWHVGISRELGRPRLQDAYKASNVLIEAEKVYGQAILDLGYLLNKEHDVLILLKASLAQILNELGRSAEAEVLLLATLASSRNISSTLPVLRALKETYFLLGRFNDVEVTVLEEKALWDQGNHKSSMAFYDSNAMEEETLLRDLAAVYWHQGKYKEMEATVMRRIEVTKKLYGEADRQTLSSMTDLAAVHIHFGRMEQARGILHHAIPIAEKILGKDDPDVLEMSYQLSFAVSTRRERKAGAIIATRNLEDRKRVLGDRNITTQVSVQGLAYNLDHQGRRREALELRETSLKVSRESIGENHPRTAEAMSMLAISYFRFGRWEEGEVLQARGVDVYMNAFGEHHIDTKAATDRLACFRRWIRFRAFVARVIPQSIFMVVIRFLESSNAWVQRTLHYYA
jgi:tetratricopeptide (TPR) repeat protein